MNLNFISVFRTIYLMAMYIALIVTQITNSNKTTNIATFGHYINTILVATFCLKYMNRELKSLLLLTQPNNYNVMYLHLQCSFPSIYFSRHTFISSMVINESVHRSRVFLPPQFCIYKLPNYSRRRLFLLKRFL